LVMRFFVPALWLTLAAFAAGWLGRRLLGRRLRGLSIALWGAVFGAIGVFAAGYALDALGLASGFVDLGESSLRVAFLMLWFFGWNVGIIGGIAGALVASIRRPHPPHQP
jgi:hypothetical protein